MGEYLCVVFGGCCYCVGVWYVDLDVCVFGGVEEVGDVV